VPVGEPLLVELTVAVINTLCPDFTVVLLALSLVVVGASVIV
jgi:hypothetical protein